MKEEKAKTNLKNGKKLKILVCTLIVFLIALIAIFGIYTKYQNRMINNVKSYSYGMDLKGERTIILSPSTETETKIKDSEGNEVADAENLTDEELTQKGYIKEEEMVYKDMEIIIDNYNKLNNVNDRINEYSKIDDAFYALYTIGDDNAKLKEDIEYNMLKDDYDKINAKIDYSKEFYNNEVGEFNNITGFIPNIVKKVFKLYNYNVFR